MARDQPVGMGYGFTADVDTRIARRWFFKAQGYPAVRETIDQMDNRALFELVSKSDSGNAYTSGYQHRIMATGKSSGVSVFTHRLKHPFLVDQQYDYYPTGRIAHNYVRIENCSVNMMPTTAPATVEAAMVDAAQRIGSIRDGYHRKVEHIGGTPRIQLIEDLLQYGSQTVTEVPLFPPKPTTFATPDRFFLRTTDMGYKHYVKSSYSAAKPYEALETKDVTGMKTWIWDGNPDNENKYARETDITGVTSAENETVTVDDIETVVNAALNNIDTSLNNTWLADDKAWEVFNIPGRTKIKISNTQAEITQYASDYSTVAAQFKMVWGGDAEMSNAGNKVTLGTSSGDVVITDGTRTITMNGSTVDVT